MSDNIDSDVFACPACGAEVYAVQSVEGPIVFLGQHCQHPPAAGTTAILMTEYNQRWHARRLRALDQLRAVEEAERLLEPDSGFG